VVKYFDEEWPKEEELLRLGLEMSRKNKADRFPTAGERWPRGGEVIQDKKPMRAYMIGNGESRKGFDLSRLRNTGKIFGCNALHREFLPDVITAVDHGIMHEIYHAGVAQKIPCYFRDWTKVPAMIYDDMLTGGLDKLEVDKIKESGKFIKENKKNDAKEFVMHGANLKGLVKIKKETGEIEPTNINHAVLRVSWIQQPDYSHSLTDYMPNNKDHGWACGASAGYIACEVYKAKEVYLIGHDLYSTNEKVNNLFAGTEHYVSKDNSPTPAVNWIRQWKAMFDGFQDVSFYKVNRFNDGRDQVNGRIKEWEGTKNLFYIDYSTLDNIL
tara:strand:- start:537 stop:1517 length:981 start_codon:yes stop_codon:yes gene_type:complete